MRSFVDRIFTREPRLENLERLTLTPGEINLIIQYNRMARNHPVWLTYLQQAAVNKSTFWQLWKNRRGKPFLYKIRQKYEEWSSEDLFPRIKGLLYEDVANFLLGQIITNHSRYDKSTTKYLGPQATAKLWIDLHKRRGCLSRLMNPFIKYIKGIYYPDAVLVIKNKIVMVAEFTTTLVNPHGAIKGIQADVSSFPNIFSQSPLTLLCFVIPDSIEKSGLPDSVISKINKADLPIIVVHLRGLSLEDDIEQLVKEIQERVIN